MPTIVVSDWVKRKLEEIKKKEGHKSLDSVIRTLILRYELCKEQTRS